MDEICRTYGLRPIELVDKPVFDAAFGLLKEPVSDYTFANTFIWRGNGRLASASIEGHVCVFAKNDDGLSLLMPPMGEGDLALCLKHCFHIMDDYNARRGERFRSRIEFTSAELLPRLTALGLTAEPMSGDYVYATARLIDLAGQDLKSKRHLRSRFLREHEVWTEPLAAHHVPECLALLHRWHGAAQLHDTSGDTATATLRRWDLEATEQALLHFPLLGLTGMALWADGRLVGFTLGEALTDRQTSIVIEKADRSVAGAAQYIFSEFCRQYWHAYPECNVGDDWDIPSLAWTKESYRPLYRLPKWVLRPAAQPVQHLITWKPAEPEPYVQEAAGPEVTGSQAAGPNVAGLEPAEPEAIRPEAAGPEPAEVKADGPDPAGPQAAGPEAPHAVGPSTMIEPASLADVFGIAALEQQVFPPDQAVRLKQVRYLLRSPRTVAVVARVGAGGPSPVVGWAVALIRRHRTRVSARLYSVAADPAQRRRGLGEQLVRAVLAALEEKEITRCVLEVADDNAPARHLYERLGFTYVRSLPDYYGPGRHGWRMARERTMAGSAEEALSLHPRR